MRVPDLLEGNSVREIVIAGTITAGVLLIAWVARTFTRYRFGNAAETASELDDFLADLAKRTKMFFLFLPAVFLGIRALHFPPDLRRMIRIGASLSMVAQTALWVSGLIEVWLRRYRRARIEHDPAAVTTINAFRLAAVVVVWSIAFVVAIDNLGFHVTTLITGLGIGGVAVALALQNILGDLFASLSIVLDKPFVIGDTIMVDKQVGTVESIGLKTTRLRSVGGEQLIFSNGDLLGSRIHNFKRMVERRSFSRIGLAYRTPPEKLERIPLLLRAAVEKQKDTRFDRAHFIGFGESAYEIELAYFVNGADYRAFLDVQQAVNLDILRALAAEGVEFAHPARTVVVTNA